MPDKSCEEMELNELRANIESITKSIIDLIGAREKLSEEVARIKRKRGLPIENLRVESKLSKEIGEYAKGVAVSESLAKIVLSEILESSKVIQRERFYAQSIREYLESEGIRTVGIIGAGRMGGWFASYFSHVVANVRIYDSQSDKASKLAKRAGIRNFKKFSLESVAQNSDLLLVCVPIGRTVPMIKALERIGKSSGRIMEIASVKSPIDESGLLARKIGKMQILSIHPLFGPDAKAFGSNLMIFITPRPESSDSQFISRLFPHYKILTMRPGEHDRAMSYILGLAHMLALAFAKIVSENKELEAKLREGLSGPSFDRLVQLSSRVLSENPNVYYEIQSLNKNNTLMLASLERALKELKVSRHDKKKFRKIFTNARREPVFRLVR